jgi:predicted metal-binding membrane protein
MLPSAIAPTLIYIAVARKASLQGNPVAPSLALVSGYLGVWLAFGVAATAGQWGLDRLSLLSASMSSNNAVFGGAVIVAVGLYQLTPLKARCLKWCRDPARLLAGHWHPGARGAVRMGAELGVYCLGCCWVLMALLFVGGVMNLIWVAAIAAFILLEKIAPMAEKWGRVIGVAMIVTGAASAALA